MIFRSFVSDPPKTYYDGEDHDERIKYVLRRSTLVTIPWIVGVIILAVIPVIAGPMLASIKIDNKTLLDPSFLFVTGLFWYLFTFGFFFQSFLNWFFNLLIITNKKIVDIDFLGITYKNISETTLENVEDVTSNVTGSLGIIFNIGNVYIQTAGEKREFEFSGIDNPSKIRDLISDLVSKVKYNVRRR